MLANRLLRIRDTFDNTDTLLDVDEIVIVERFDFSPVIHPTGARDIKIKGLQITFRDGKYRLINSDLSVAEFESLRNAFFEEDTSE